MIWLFLLLGFFTPLSAADYVLVNSNQPIIDTDEAIGLKYTVACTLGGLVGLGHVACNIMEGHYCIYNPIPGGDTGIWINLTVVPVLGITIGAAAGWWLGKAVGYCCLKNHGKKILDTFFLEESA